jgi:hypothetical protein
MKEVDNGQYKEQERQYRRQRVQCGVSMINFLIHNMVAEYKARKILDELRSRKGFEVLDNLDEEILEEIVEEIRAIIKS